MLHKEARPWRKCLNAPKSTRRVGVDILYGVRQVEQVLQKAAEHAKEHGIREVTPELMERVKANIRDA